MFSVSLYSTGIQPAAENSHIVLPRICMKYQNIFCRLRISNNVCITVWGRSQACGRQAEGTWLRGKSRSWDPLGSMIVTYDHCMTCMHDPTAHTRPWGCPCTISRPYDELKSLLQHYRLRFTYRYELVCQWGGVARQTAKEGVRRVT